MRPLSGAVACDWQPSSELAALPPYKAAPLSDMDCRVLLNPGAVTFLAAVGWLGTVGSTEAPVTFLAAENKGIFGSSEAPVTFPDARGWLDEKSQEPTGQPLVVGSK